jgi:hypothetical protein
VKRVFNVIAAPLESRLQPALFFLCLGAILLVASLPTSNAFSDDVTLPDVTLPDEPPIRESDRQHWAYRPVANVAVPEAADAAWGANAIDRFILVRLEAEGLRPQPAADRLTLLRRATFDLTGLPPTPAEIAAFVADDAADAYDRLLDRLLASPAYGERWGQHWLDLARFAETDGFEFDHVRPEDWRYRDWVIDALNGDLPYDRFLALQLAADELAPGDSAALQATGFLLAGPDMPDINLQEERRHTLLNELTATVGSAVLGLQFGCAACHDHKFDPISQADFYRLRAFFDPADVTAKHPAGRVIVEAAGPAAASYLYERGDFRRPAAVVRPAFPRIANAQGTDVAWETTPGTGGTPLAREETAPGTSGRRAALARWLTSPDNPLTARVIVNRLWQHHFGQGLVRTTSDFGAMGDTPSHPDLLDWLAAELVRGGWHMKRMHRLMMSSATYRQASRATGHAEDFDGGVGFSPRGDFADETCVGSSPRHETAIADFRRAREADPHNRLLARMSRQRLEGEAIRDAMLAAAGRLSRRRGGPGVMPRLPAEMLATLLKDQWVESPDQEDHRRRGVYVFVRRNLRYPLFDVLDAPDRSATCARRNQTTTATQALWLFNSEFSLSLARDFAGLLLREAPNDEAARIELAFRRALGRPPTAQERPAAEEFLCSQASHLRETGRAADDLALPAGYAAAPPPSNIDPHAAAALVDFCLALFNLNEFAYVD